MEREPGWLQAPRKGQAATRPAHRAAPRHRRDRVRVRPRGEQAPHDGGVALLGGEEERPLRVPLRRIRERLHPSDLRKARGSVSKPCRAAPLSNAAETPRKRAGKWGQGGGEEAVKGVSRSGRLQLRLHGRASGEQRLHRLLAARSGRGVQRRDARRVRRERARAARQQQRDELPRRSLARQVQRAGAAAAHSVDGGARLEQRSSDVARARTARPMKSGGAARVQDAR